MTSFQIPHMVLPQEGEATEMSVQWKDIIYKWRSK
jgi:hypothetical protein